MTDATEDCTHFEAAVFVDPGDLYECEECMKIGGEWVHLRRCMICGKVGCCNDSPNTHATKHFEATGHTIMRSIEPDESWGYCFVHDVGIEDVAEL